MFYEELNKLSLTGITKEYTQANFDYTLEKDLLNLEDLALLLSPIAVQNLERMAIRANQETINNFGKTIQLFTPIYLGNYCENQCVYCAFNEEFKVVRKKLNLQQVKDECESIARTGLDEVLLLTGESRKHTGVDYISACSQIASAYFNGVGVEIYPLSIKEYQEIIQAGVSGLTIYQETYHENKYAALHKAGPKKNFKYRLDAPERGAIAGMNKINIGALLGLANPIEDAYKTGAHLHYLMKHYPEVEWGISLPRLKRIENGAFEGEAVSDALFVRILLAFRLVFPKIGINISTREEKMFREQLIPLGVTKMSAGVSTAVGRLNHEEASTQQFEISDSSSVSEVKEMITKKGYQVIFKNWVKI